jgi:hypothetical protein
MFRTPVKLAATLLAAAAVAVPTATASSSRPSTPGPGYSLGPGYLQYVTKTGWFAPALERARRSIPTAFAEAQVPEGASEGRGPGYSLGPGYLEYLQHNANASTASSSSPFDWGDFGIGAAAMLGLTMLVGGLALIAVRAHIARRTIGEA